jgi:NhaP-type Na+/H+ or K+/H+ antiporter
LAVSIALIVILGLLSDYMFRKLRLPGLVGMLLVGVVLGPYVLGLMRPELMSVSADLRMVALIVILLRAGLELRRETINKVGRTALIMSTVPAIFESTVPAIFEGAVITVVAPMLFGITYLEAAILGSIIAAVSPAVVVPLMVDFIRKRKGAKKGIPTMILGASSLDDVFVIVVFTILMGMHAGSYENVYLKLFEIPEAVLLGAVAGALTGYVLYRLFEHFHLRATKMTIVVVACSILLMWLEEELKTRLEMSALIGVMTVGVILLEKTEHRAHKISEKLSKVWIFAEILLFVLVGAQVDVRVALDAGAAGALLIFAGLIARSVGTYVSVLGAGLNFREKLFCVISYIPKATVQAAIGAVPLEAGLPAGEVILAVSVLSILITAPLGAIGIMYTGKRWLGD